MDYSFDIVSQINLHEVTNALDQAKKEILTRYDFKGTKSELNQEASDIIISSEDEFRLKSITEILLKRLASRGIPLKNIRYGVVDKAALGMVKQKLTLQNGIPQETAKTIVRKLKDSKFKAQASIQSDQVRVSSKSKDELQEIIAFLKKETIDVDLQFTNYR